MPFCFWFILRGNHRWMLAAAIALYLLTTLSPKLHGALPRLEIGFLVYFKYIIAGVILALLWETISGYMEGLSIAVPLLLVAWLFVDSYFGDLTHLTLARITEFTEAIVIAAMIAWFIQNPLSCGFLRWPPLQWLGMCSYSLYLWQQLYTGPPTNYGWMPLFELEYGMPLLLISAATSYYFIERPFVALGRRLMA